MKIWRLVPRYPRSLAMTAESWHRGIAIIRARTEFEARFIADLTFATMPFSSVVASPWSNSTAVHCEEDFTLTFEKSGPPEVLVPAPDQN